MSKLPDFKLETYFTKWEFSARYNMTASDLECHTIGDILAYEGPAAIDTFLAEPLSYTEVHGSEDVREAAANTYDNLEMRDILCFAGAEEGIYAYYRVLLDKDSHAIAITPNYQAAESIPGAICDTTGVPLEVDENWTLDIDRVAAAMRPNTKSIYINFPHNPTGKILERDRFDALIELCRKHGIYIFSDEVFRLIERDPKIRLPQIADIYERGVSLNVMSKAYGLPGLRVGWTGCQDRDLLDSMAKYKHYLSICNSGPSERLTVIALKHREKILQRNQALATMGRAKIATFFAEYPHLFEAYEPDGGVILYPRYIGPGGVEEFCDDLVEKSGVLLLPGSIYQTELNTDLPTDRFRIGYGRKDIDEGLQAMREHINSHL
jgi:aspartate/methionine/tyrosine aminotransferase